jgi:hypothetical protein
MEVCEKIEKKSDDLAYETTKDVSEKISPKIVPPEADEIMILDDSDEDGN